MEYFRTDKANFKVIETGEGFLKAKITIARPGVFKYINDDGTVSNEAKLPGDILSIDTLKSAQGAPITDDHPRENGKHVLVDSENYNKYVRGTISEPKIENSEITALATIYDAELIKKIKRKKQNEASIGFIHSVDGTPGIFDGIKYDIAQRNIIINHVALVTSGRAGENVKIHIDKKGDNNMSKKWIVDGSDASNLLTYRKFDNSIDIQVESEIHGELMTIKNDGKEKDKEISSLKDDNKKLKDQIEKIKADKNEDPEKEKLLNDLEIANDKAEEWKKKHDELEKTIPNMVEESSKSRVELMEFARSVDSKMKVDSLSNKDIKLQIIAKGLPFKDGIRIDSVSDEVVEARYDAACELLRERATDSNDNDVNISKVDKNSIAEKRANLSQIYQKTQEKLNS